MATKTQTITFTALPNGVVGPGGNLRLSVHISPRLWTSDGPDAQVLLSQFGDWVDWPSAAITFQVQFDTAAPFQATPVGPAPRSDMWQALFPQSTYLRPHSFDPSIANTKITTYSVKDVHTKLRTVYTYFAKKSPNDYPTATELIDDPTSPLTEIAAPFKPVAIPTATKGPALASVMAADPTPYDHLKSVETFHNPFTNNQVAITTPDIEFHQMLSALGRYPVLMRMLGLVRDFEIARPAGAVSTVRVIASWPGAPTLPRIATRCKITNDAFYATPRTTAPELSDDGLGMLRLGDATMYELVQVNQDSAAVKTLRFAETVVRATKISSTTVVGLFNSVDTPDKYSLPALGTAGLAVARTKRKEQVEGSFTLAANNNDLLLKTLEPGNTDKVMLDAEDVTRGYAVDVYDTQSAQWHSLCQRLGRYAIAGAPVTVNGDDRIADEGWVSMGLTTAADGSSPEKAKLPETIFNWWGWSLVAPRPGKTMGENGEPTLVQNQAATQFKLTADFVATPGSLPRLRYGTTYRLRARAVDLAGNRTPRSAVTAFENATDIVTFGRYEPVTSPEVVLDSPLAEGDARDRVVVRSNFDTAIEGPARRHIAPPKAAEPMLEILGLFDAANGIVDPDAYKLLQEKDGGSWVDIGKPDPNNPGVYYVTEQSSAILPYLPDVLSRGAIWREMPGASSPVRVPFYEGGKAWPDALPFDLVLREGTGAPAFEAGPRDLNVQLGKGDVVTVRLNSYMDQAKGDVNRMALVHWMDDDPQITDQDAATFQQQVADGTHWMVTPFHRLALVHAVRQPLLRPEYKELKETRQAAQTFAPLEDKTFVVSRKSTTRIDVLAEWDETIDSLVNTGPIVSHGHATPIQFPVPLDPSNENTIQLSGKHEFGDTKYRHVLYTAHATSRFAEYFAERKSRMNVHAGQQVSLHPPVTDDGVNWGGVVEGSEVVTAADRTTKYARGTDYTMDYAAGTLTPNASLDGQTVNITFIAPPIVRRTAAPTPLDIRSSARPAAPKVMYMVPTFGWTSSANQAGTEYKSERRGGGLRAYIERPWFSSGDGELLGVVIWPNGAPPDDAKPFMSDWGLDPMYKSASTTTAPTVNAFSLATEKRTSGMKIEELSDVPTVHVAAHPVAYDATRQLWYCDLEIDAGQSYTPFVRLAFARFQPNSVPGLHLSRIQLADFVQLTANRTASLTRDSKQSDTLNVAVAGLSYSRAQSAAGPSTVEVSLEERRANVDPDAAGELGWEGVAGSTTQLTGSAGPTGLAMWAGQITLPKGPPRQIRVIIREFERFGPAATDRRLVYADAIVV
jgi:hypothetical protein